MNRVAFRGLAFAAEGSHGPVMNVKRSLGFTCLLLCQTAFVWSNDWPQFRGPGGQGHAEGVEVPLRWGPNDEEISWKVAIAGKAWSSPILVGDRVYLTTAVESASGLSLRALAVSLGNGKTIWDEEVFAKPDVGAFHKKNSHASPTPVYEEGKLFVHYGHHGTACLAADSGKTLWKQESLVYPPLHGNGGSPILLGDKLIFSCDGREDPFIVALDKSNGKVAWKTSREVEVSRPFSFSTPLAIQVKGGWQVVSPASGAVISYDPETGKEIWRSRYGEGYSVVPRPLYAHGLVYVCSGFGTATLYAIDPTGTGDVTESHVRWEVGRRIPKESSPIIVGDYLFVNDDKGILSCIQAKTGKQVWQKRVDGSGGFSGSPVYAGGHLFFHNGDGITTVIKPATAFERVAENRIGEYGLSSFAVAKDGFVVRTEKSLMKIGG